MPSRPAAVAFDVVETLFPLEPLRPRLVALGLPPHALELWFTRLLRDAMALDAAGRFASFREVGAGALEVVCGQHGVSCGEAEAAAVLDGLAELPAHPDAAPAFRRLAEAGVAVATVSNGGVGPTRALLERAGLLPLVARVAGVDEVRRWKPNAAVYRHVCDALALPPERVALVAVHAWDVQGARAAGLLTGWASRLERRWQPAMPPPDVRGVDLVEVAEALLALG
ncbi:haloacid dehalogenase type II [Anaeromyxobacter paludicola]|uniref:Haloacid dehalogenase n=1 Tax=Anaeromyxobacter paludicola TaxID=2918171 RepID=A0ABM7XA61_9BACT|nr:haloacid dehalogenase type II [Anaeromyxobacter paludicola]BDG08733.1 haloacid dehalogenase [Anaeromyxobacter paludicola]